MTRQTQAPIEHTNFNPMFRRASAIVDDVRRGNLDLHPPYQRGSVWNDEQRMNLIESWLYGVPTGPIVLVDRANGKWKTEDGQRPLYDDVDVAMWGCADGQQRITTAMAWFDGEFAVPASWFDGEFLETTEETADGPYVRFTGLTKPGQLKFDLHLASFQVSEDRTCTGMADEARTYLLINTSGTAQTSADLDNARRVAAGG
ncbi:DUF262 domain-containing protein [Streptomyces tirandamycinicus]|uniref:GmrSD restriction endonucleases N-terminal domain-containing protein n=1 Tax=Streptomyces tirandamycinicus TaxID=2174846 RepID=A0A2S1T233_9ACTN|nr:DUF262 domain-containing protein [Streptomyces tirandamycinicus]AWI32722.1 hypothetical protein DDW44_30890 [Streptomyces tirandamycinicus]